MGGIYISKLIRNKVNGFKNIISLNYNSSRLIRIKILRMT
ncbi:MAG: hypothetical protein BAJALOKI2v1_120007 [Promethearchaeota archaeon]|nr:MAG: hypothetical protein BAJALOKI2v1_120007 [Candidatus Lokiarchaeota archaeon]